MQSIFDYFWQRVDKGDDCWEWTGPKKETTAGRRYGVVLIPAHRLSYEYHKGLIEPGKHIHHTCNNPGCVNPAHLEMVTAKENAHAGPHNATKTHCKQGHEYTEENTGHQPDGRRYCRTCRRRWSTEQAARKKAERHARGLRWGNPHGGGPRDA